MWVGGFKCGGSWEAGLVTNGESACSMVAGPGLRKTALASLRAGCGEWQADSSQGVAPSLAHPRSPYHGPLDIS